ncbi:MAG: hypothetical protein MJ200_00910 [Mycoplasmoidaceae bacterium]|nr:hypothetical protein [Mycoplasmoidaceae bacterium]
MPSLYYGYSRTTQVHTPDEVETSSDGLGYYFSYIINNKNILIDDFFSAIAKMPLDFDTPL